MKYLGLEGHPRDVVASAPFGGWTLLGPRVTEFVDDPTDYRWGPYVGAHGRFPRCLPQSKLSMLGFRSQVGCHFDLVSPLGTPIELSPKDLIISPDTASI